MIVNITVSVRMDRSIRVRGSLITVLTFFKDCKQLWYPKMTYFGQCLQFSTFNLDQKESDVGKKEIQMS